MKPGDGMRARHEAMVAAMADQDALIAANTAAIQALDGHIVELIALIATMKGVAETNAAALAAMVSKIGRIALDSNGKIRTTTL